MLKRNIKLYLPIGQNSIQLHLNDTALKFIRYSLA